jgi:DnaJ-class molecular chaperone
MMNHRCRNRVRKENGGMPSLDCPRCEGSGYVQEDEGETTICARCDGTGVVFVDGNAGDALGDAGD